MPWPPGLLPSSARGSPAALPDEVRADTKTPHHPAAAWPCRARPVVFRDASGSSRAASTWANLGIGSLRRRVFALDRSGITGPTCASHHCCSPGSCLRMGGGSAMAVRGRGRVSPPRTEGDVARLRWTGCRGLPLPAGTRPGDLARSVGKGTGSSCQHCVPHRCRCRRAHGRGRSRAADLLAADGVRGHGVDVRVSAARRLHLADARRPPLGSRSRTVCASVPGRIAYALPLATPCADSRPL